MGWLEEYGEEIGWEWIGWINNGMACTFLGFGLDQLMST